MLSSNSFMEQTRKERKTNPWQKNTKAQWENRKEGQREGGWPVLGSQYLLRSACYLTSAKTSLEKERDEKEVRTPGEKAEGEQRRAWSTLEFEYSEQTQVVRTLFFVCLFFCCIWGMWKFPGQVSNLYCSSNPSHYSDITKSLTHWATR